MKHVGRVVLPLVLVLAIAACGGGDDDDDDGAPSEPGVVIVQDNTFQPEQLRIGVGDTATWRFEGNSAHNVAFEEGENSDLMKDGEFERTFDEAGSFDYTCTVHPGMDGTIDVSGSAVP